MNERISPKEVLIVRNFLSIKEIYCEFKQFNVIAGEMSSGKSITIKLIKYFQDVIFRLFNDTYNDFCKYLEVSAYYSVLKKKFNDIFFLSSLDSMNPAPFEIIYTFSYEKKAFSMTINGTSKENIEIKSSYLEELLGNWKNQAIENNMLSPEKHKFDKFEEFRRSLYDDIQKEFNQHFPILTAFTSATRAAMAYRKEFSDYYMDKYYHLIDTLKRQTDNPEYIKTINSILKAMIEIEKEDISLVSNDSRKVPLKKASSGQQEIIYILMQLSKLFNKTSYYDNARSLLIEEPEAQLYPYEQMKIINFIVRAYNDQEKNQKPVRIYITTHSPYILNSLNNLLIKGSVFRDSPDTEQVERIMKEVYDDDLPPLLADDVSAYQFYFEKGMDKSVCNSMMDRDYIYTEKIIEISNVIDRVFDKLWELRDDLKRKKE
jgi:predicted ATPase